MGITRTIFLLSSLLFLYAAEVKAAWKIELVSGGSVEANSCRIEKGRVYLGYPMGEASFPLSRVRSVSQDDTGVEMFQEKGAPQARKCPAVGTGNGRPAGMPAIAGIPGDAAQAGQASPPGTFQGHGKLEVKPQFTRETLSELRRQSVEVQRPRPGTDDPEAEEIIRGLEGADKARQAELEKKMGELFEKDSPRN